MLIIALYQVVLTYLIQQVVHVVVVHVCVVFALVEPTMRGMERRCYFGLRESELFIVVANAFFTVYCICGKHPIHVNDCRRLW